MEERGRLNDWESIHQFILAGNATFTIVSRRTADRFTYKVSAIKPREGEDPKASEGKYFVALMNGPDNENNYVYMGMLVPDGQFHRFTFTRASRVGKDALSAKGIVWLVDRLIVQRAADLEYFEFWHEGRCGRCGRKLTVPSSIEMGIGPECAGRMEAA